MVSSINFLFRATKLDEHGPDFTMSANAFPVDYAELP